MPQCRIFGQPFVQVAHLSQRDRATPKVSWNLVSCCTTVRKKSHLTRRIALSFGIKNIAGRFFGLVAKHACDGQTDRITAPKTALTYLRRAVKTISSTRPSCWMQISTINVINIAADRQKFMRRSAAVPVIWLSPPKFKWFTWLNHALSGMPYHPRASNCYRQSTYQIRSLYLHSLRRYERRYKMSKMGWFGVVSVTQGHWK